MNDHGRDIPTIGKQGDAPPPEKEWDNTPVWGKVTDVAWDLDEAGSDYMRILDCHGRLQEIVRDLDGQASVSGLANKLWLCAGDIDAAVPKMWAGKHPVVDTERCSAIVDTLDEIAAELHEELYVKRGIVL